MGFCEKSKVRRITSTFVLNPDAAREEDIYINQTSFNAACCLYREVQKTSLCGLALSINSKKMVTFMP